MPIDARCVHARAVDAGRAGYQRCSMACVARSARGNLAGTMECRRRPTLNGAGLTRASSRLAIEATPLLVLHHIASDGWSLGVLVRELTALYAGETLTELPIQYADYAAWQRERLTGDALEEELAWWRERLAGSPPSLDLPFDRPRPAVQTFYGGRAVRVLPAVLVDRLRTLAGSAGASLFMVLLAGFQLLLSRWSGQEDVPVGSRIRGRYKLLDVKDVDAKTILVNWGVTGEIEGSEKPILIAETLSRRSA